MANETHKLNIKRGLANTDCGLNVIAFYPQNMYAMTDRVGEPNVKVTFGKPTCKECKEREKE